MATAVAWSRSLVALTVLVTSGHLVGAPAIGSTVALVIAGAGFVAGVPHGAVDHLVATRLTRGRPLALVAVAYAGVAAVAWALMTWAGPIPLLVVVALSAMHFGLGELEVTRQVTGWRPDRLPSIAIVIAGSGTLTLPLARSSDQFRAVATAVSPDLAALIDAAPIRIGLVAAWVVAAAIAGTAALWSGRPAIVVDIALIGALGLIAPPLVAFAVWFGGWHALRHSARMMTVEPGCAALLAAGQRRAAVRRLVKLAALPSIAALSAVAVLGWFTLSAPDPTTIVAEVLRLLLALTVPHMLVVAWLDRSHAQTSPLPAALARSGRG